MTLATQTSKIIYAGLTGQDTFAYNFRVDFKVDMEVYLDAVIIPDGDWTITDLGDPTGGNVILNTPLVADASVTLLRSVDLTQQVDYQPFDAFPSETHEQALDKLTMLCQQLQEQVDRGVQLPVDSPLDGYDVGIPVAEMVIQYRADLTGQESSGLTVSGLNQVVIDAEAARDASAVSAGESAASATVSSDAAVASAGFRDKSQEWAENPEDVEVETGEFSALHWSAKAEGFAAVISKTTISDTAPVSPNPGDRWWASDIGRAFIFYDDGSSSQWVDENP